jgi:hypothetical protein
MYPEPRTKTRHQQKYKVNFLVIMKMSRKRSRRRQCTIEEQNIIKQSLVSVCPEMALVTTERDGENKGPLGQCRIP